jgi:glutathione reductase (NADPH)
MSEMKALGMGYSIDVYKSTFKPLKHTMTGSEERSLFKMVVDQKTQLVLGCHIFGWGAAEIIQMAAVALKMGARKSDFDATIALHPTAAEELVTMRAKTYSKTP